MAKPHHKGVPIGAPLSCIYTKLRNFMDTLIKSTLLSSVSAGGKIKAPRQPNIWCGDVANGYLPGDLVDANGLADFIIENDLLHDDPEF